MSIRVSPRTQRPALRRLTRWAAATALAATWATAVPTAPAQASDQTYPGTNGRLLYSTAGTPALQSLDPQAANPSTTVTPIAGADRNGAYSPDGNRIAYYNATERRVRVMNANGTGNIPVTGTLPAGSSVLGLRWSPNGQRLSYFGTAPGTTTRDVWSLSSTTTATTPLRHTVNASVEGQPSWANDSVSLAYTARHGGTDNELYIVKVTGGGSQQVTNDTVHQGYPVWSPNGHRIAYVVADPVANTNAIAVTGTNNIFGSWSIGGTGIVEPAASNVTRPMAGWPSWSADSSRLAVPYRSSEGIVVYTTPPGGIGTWPRLQTNVLTEATSLVWSPDGAKIAFVPRGNAPLRMATINANGTGLNIILSSQGYPESWQRR